MKWTSTEKAEVMNALRDCVDELLQIYEGCDHSVGICECQMLRRIENAQKLIARYERSAKFIAELEGTR